MGEWVANTLYDELIAMPLWLHSAFGSFKIGEVLKSDDVRVRLIVHLIGKTIAKCPTEYYDKDYRMNVRASDGIAIIKSALNATAKFNL